MNQLFNQKENNANPINRNINNNPINNNPFRTQVVNNNAQNQFVSKEENQSEIGLVNTNSKTNPDISNLFKSCSNKSLKHS